MQKVTPCIWFSYNCEEAINHYVNTFNGSPKKLQESKITSIQRYEAGMNTPGIEDMVGKVVTAIFELNGQSFMALDGGPTFTLSEAVSFQIECEDQEELDYFWKKLSAVPESEQCGWCKDKFGLSWQIVPKRLGELMESGDAEKTKRVMNALLEMHKIDIDGLEKAAKGE